jgi:DNA-directed RNA polymerase specialized sigma24 family protein
VTSDAELIRWSLAGDGEPFVEMIRRHEAAVGSYLTRRAGRAVAEDLLGDVWVAAFGSRASYDGAYPNARPWLFGIALNCLRRYWRSRPAEHVFSVETVVEQGWDPWQEVDERIEGEAVIRRALAELRPDEREIVT